MMVMQTETGRSEMTETITRQGSTYEAGRRGYEIPVDGMTVVTPA